MAEFFTTRQVAEMLCVDIGKVGDWLAAGDLVGVNVARTTGGIRPRWRISREALDAFLAARQTQRRVSVPRESREKRGVVLLVPHEKSPPAEGDISADGQGDVPVPSYAQKRRRQLPYTGYARRRRAAIRRAEQWINRQIDRWRDAGLVVMGDVVSDLYATKKAEELAKFYEREKRKGNPDD